MIKPNLQNYCSPKNFNTNHLSSRDKDKATMIKQNKKYQSPPNFKEKIQALGSPGSPGSPISVKSIIDSEYKSSVLNLPNNLNITEFCVRHREKKSKFYVIEDS